VVLDGYPLAIVSRIIEFLKADYFEQEWNKTKDSYDKYDDKLKFIVLWIYKTYIDDLRLKALDSFFLQKILLLVQSSKDANFEWIQWVIYPRTYNQILCLQTFLSLERLEVFLI